MNEQHKRTNKTDQPKKTKQPQQACATPPLARVIDQNKLCRSDVIKRGKKRFRRSGFSVGCDT
jgi:hypothetical protein